MTGDREGIWTATTKHDTLLADCWLGTWFGRLDMLIPNAVYRFTRTDRLTYYQAGRTPSGIDYLSPIRLDGSDLISRHASGRDYLILYFVTAGGALAAGGYWLDTAEPFTHVYVTDATIADLDLVTDDIASLPSVDRRLDDVLHRYDIQLDMEVWGSLLP